MREWFDVAKMKISDRISENRNENCARIDNKAKSPPLQHYTDPQKSTQIIEIRNQSIKLIKPDPKAKLTVF